MHNPSMLDLQGGTEFGVVWQRKGDQITEALSTLFAQISGATTEVEAKGLPFSPESYIFYSSAWSNMLKHLKSPAEVETPLKNAYIPHRRAQQTTNRKRLGFK